MMQFELQKQTTSIIKVIGVGGGGSNAVNHMYRQGIKGVDFLVCNTDHQALDISPVPLRIQLGPSLTQGRGAGAIPEIGKKAAIENLDEIRDVLNDGTKMVFITAGMGGGTGTGAAPIIAGLAKDLGILTIGIVTIPFGFEGRKRRMHAEQGIEELKKSVDALLIICNDKLREIYGNLNITNAFGHADNILTVAAKSIAEIINITMQINVDFADIETVMRESGVAIMGSGSAEGENRATLAVEQALDSPLLNDSHIEGARHILLNILSGTEEVTMDEMSEITEYIQREAGQTAEIIMGLGKDESLGSRIAVTVIATGFKTSTQIVTEHKATERIVHILKADDQPNGHGLPKEEPFSSPEGLTHSESLEPFLNETSIALPYIDPALEPVLIVREEETIIQISEQNEIPEVRTIGTVTEMFIPGVPEPVAEDKDSPGTMEFVFPVDESTPPVRQPRQEINPEMQPARPFDEPDPNDDDAFRKTRERIMRLRELNYKINTPSGIADLEREPAYKRKNIRLDNVPNSADSNVSRYTLSLDETENKMEIRPNNPFLHDRVD